ncbi:type II secretion system secretin GspD [Propionivibrio dicarboxylicus]|uniref:Type IV pilus biogenesis and competence protein PilQ n=1 Tax=Propionivibrio dicarboxylicus TaxID=83767 RepID=A0A1G8AKE2_9RHOO|nr:type II secretion system secretin GspD [Propionivibrio dicarboxylicus]SDH21492.1 general secretion pathway protein D [Propionivibrio dicarboxylicus]
MISIKPFRSTSIGLLLAATLQIAQAAEDLLTLNFVDSDIPSTVKAIGVITGKNFLIDPKVKGSINIVSNQPVAKELIYPIMLSALRQHGYTAIDNGTIIKIIPDVEAKTQTTQLVARKTQSSGDKLITKIFPLTYESASQLVTTLRPLVTANNLIAAYQGNNTIVITDYADNVTRIGQIIDNIDHPPQNDIQPIAMRYISALDAAQTIGRLLPEVFVQGASAPASVPEGVRRTVVVPDVRSNQLLVRSEVASHVKQIKSLVASLDQPAASGSNINVVYLRNAEALRLAATLKGILTGQDSTAHGLTASGTNASPATNAALASGTIGTTGTAATSTSTQTLNATGASTMTSPGSASTQGGSVNVQVGGATVLIQADTVTNSLVITAPDHVYNNLRSVIDKLDVRRAQIYIEALIAEVNMSKAVELGVQWAAAGRSDSNAQAALLSSISPTSTNLGTLYSSVKSASSGSSSSSSSVTLPSTFSLGLLNKSNSLGILASAIEKIGNGNILSTPNLLMLDNEEARITVGQNIPILTGSYTTSASGSSNPFQTVERKDIGIKLKIKPQVSDSGSITLTVAQEVSSIDESISTNGAGIATKVRLIETKVLVDDGQTIVLGGLIEDKVSQANNKVPLLGDIPVMGQLFRYETRDQQKVNLMVFLRPTVLRDGSSSAALSSARYEYLRTEQGRFDMPGNLVLDAVPKVQLPPQGGTPPAVPGSGEPTARIDVRP